MGQAHVKSASRRKKCKEQIGAMLGRDLLLSSSNCPYPQSTPSHRVTHLADVWRRRETRL
jgi:hypothetical protein